MLLPKPALAGQTGLCAPPGPAPPRPLSPALPWEAPAAPRPPSPEVQINSKASNLKIKRKTRSTCAHLNARSQSLSTFCPQNHTEASLKTVVCTERRRRDTETSAGGRKGLAPLLVHLETRPGFRAVPQPTSGHGWLRMEPQDRCAQGHLASLFLGATCQGHWLSKSSINLL